MTDILYEDEDILAIDKPQGLVAVPHRRGQSLSLFEMLCTERREKLFIVHRIDRETSGVIVIRQKRRGPPPAQSAVRNPLGGEGLSGPGPRRRRRRSGRDR